MSWFKLFLCSLLFLVCTALPSPPLSCPPFLPSLSFPVPATELRVLRQSVRMGSMGEKDTPCKCSWELMECHGDTMMAKLPIFQEFLVTEILLKEIFQFLRAIIQLRFLILYRPNKKPLFRTLHCEACLKALLGALTFLMGKSCGLLPGDQLPKSRDEKKVTFWICVVTENLMF